MISKEQLIANFEAKIKQLVEEQNRNHDSGDNGSFALRAFFENRERIDRLNFAIKQLRKRKSGKQEEP